MSLIKWSPFYADEPAENFDKLVEDFWPMRLRQNNFAPAIDMYEDNNNIVVEMQLAGLDSEKVKVEIDNNVLTLRGESEKKSEVDDKNYYRKEIRRGAFYRSLPLPQDVLGNEASAVAGDGLLKITIPKASESKPRAIEIKTLNNNN